MQEHVPTKKRKLHFLIFSIIISKCFKQFSSYSLGESKQVRGYRMSKELLKDFQTKIDFFKFGRRRHMFQLITQTKRKQKELETLLINDWEKQMTSIQKIFWDSSFFKVTTELHFLTQYWKKCTTFPEFRRNRPRKMFWGTEDKCQNLDNDSFKVLAIGNPAWKFILCRWLILAASGNGESTTPKKQSFSFEDRRDFFWKLLYNHSANRVIIQLEIDD